MKTKKILTDIIKKARGHQKADLVIKNGRFLDVFNGCFSSGDIAVGNGYIVGIGDAYDGEKIIDAKGAYIVPGFIDTHIHIESSLLTPDRFQKLIMPFGTTTIIWDPHEITNVKGIKAIQWALNSIKNLLLDVYIMMPSCVSSTSPKLQLETNGASLTLGDYSQLQDHNRILGLAEIMDFPAVLNRNSFMIDKLLCFQKKIFDGHCPTLSGKDLNAYIAAGIRNDHETTTFKEGREKLSKGMHLLIREGSCAKDADALLPLLNDYSSSKIAFCTDDNKPDDVAERGHVNFIVNKALKMGLKPESVFRAASYSAAKIYHLKSIGAIAPGYLADLCLVHPLNNNWKKGVKIGAVYKKGHLITEDTFTNIKKSKNPFPGKNVSVENITVSDIEIKSKHKSKQKVRVIGIRAKQLLTDKLEKTLPVINGRLTANLSEDIIKIAVFERHKNSGRHAVGFVKGFHLKSGAIATTINHDSHNIVVIGANDEAIVHAVNLLIKIDGGIVAVDDKGNNIQLPLPIGGLMTDAPSSIVIEKLKALKKMIKKMGCPLDEPFLQLSFLSLPVIPSLKITDRGLIDAENFKKIPVLID